MKNFGLLLIAGMIGEVGFELVAWGAAPWLLGQPMQPAVLVAELAQSLFDRALPMTAAFLIHVASGIVLFPSGYALFRAASGIRSPTAAGLAWAVALWLVAQGVLAPLAGKPFMLGFGLYTWASLAAHALYSLAVALSYDRLSRWAGSRA